MKTIELVKEFHETFGHPIGAKPNIPAKEVIDFRFDFIAEELQELRYAAEDNDIIELADGLGDIQYVLDGFFLNAGLQDKKEVIMAEIHRSNMSKVCATEHEANLTVNSLPSDLGKFYWKPVGKYFIVYRVSDNKVMKSINYSKPDLHSIIYPTT